MSVQIRNLSVLAYAQGFTHWHYKLLEHTLAEALSPGYWDTAHSVFGQYDIVLISGADGATNICVRVDGDAVFWSKVG